MKIELYIDRQLCDIGDPEKFSVYLKRELYNPTELNTKDAQVSYTITLPATNTNNTIFGFANVEEVKGKFVRLYDAELVVNGIRIFEGKFRLSEIDSYSYKGNLGIPAPKTVKEIFGDMTLNQIGKWLLEIKKDIPEYEKGFSFINYYNKKENSPCIFPFVLYGLLPRDTDKETLLDAANTTDEFKQKYKEKFKYIWDDSVRLGIEDIPPSVNCIQLIKKIFGNAEYTIGGTALSDERLQNLYVSYRNPKDYAQPWNWGDLSTMTVKGKWTMPHVRNDSSLYERQIEINRDESSGYFNVNLFNSNRLEIEEIKDDGTNIIYNEHKDRYGDEYVRKNLNLVIPYSGYYKVRLTCSDFLLDQSGEIRIRRTDPVTGINFTGVDQKNGRSNHFLRTRYELQLMRDYGTGDFNNINMAGLFNRPQFPQLKYDEDDRQTRYYPYQGGSLVVDPSVNQNFICGLHWGNHEEDGHWNPKDDDKLYANYMFIANGFSWDNQFSQKKKILCAYDSSVYDDNGMRDKYGNYNYWGRPIDALDTNGNPIYDDNDNETYKPYWGEKLVKRRYGVFPDYPAKNTQGKYEVKNYARRKSGTQAEGYVECIVWLEKGERLALCVAGDLGDVNGDGKEWDTRVVFIDNVAFSLEVEPFRTDIEWNTFDSQGNYDPFAFENMKWNEDTNFQKSELNLADFLPSSQKVDDWLENFCKAFNLILTNTGERSFELNIKQKEIASDVSNLLDLDARVHRVHRSSQTLALPYLYKLGFSNNTDEEGYYRSAQESENTGTPIETGGGVMYTGSVETAEVEQSSNFSYCWYRQLYTVRAKGNTSKYEAEDILEWIKVPVITDHEIWDKAGKDDYKEMMPKLYFDKAQRFWYKTGTRAVTLGSTDTGYGKPVDVALVSNRYGASGGLILDYEDTPDTILRHYFYLLDSNSDYTEVECPITPEEYSRLNSSLAKFNGDLYYIASIDGYDPSCRKQAKLKLIRKIK